MPEQKNRLRLLALVACLLAASSCGHTESTPSTSASIKPDLEISVIDHDENGTRLSECLELISHENNPITIQKVMINGEYAATPATVDPKGTLADTTSLWTFPDQLTHEESLYVLVSRTGRPGYTKKIINVKVETDKGDFLWKAP